MPRRTTGAPIMFSTQHCVTDLSVFIKEVNMDQCKECFAFKACGRDEDYEWSFSCSDCPCYNCAHIHDCEGQCGGVNNAQG